MIKEIKVGIENRMKELEALGWKTDLWKIQKELPKQKKDIEILKISMIKKVLLRFLMLQWCGVGYSLILCCCLIFKIPSFLNTSSTETSKYLKSAKD